MPYSRLKAILNETESKIRLMCPDSCIDDRWYRLLRRHERLLRIIKNRFPKEYVKLIANN